LRPKNYANNQQQQQQQHSSGVFQVSSKDMGKKLKRFTFDPSENRWNHQYQLVPNNGQILDSNTYRSSVAIVPSLNANVYGVQINNNNNNNNNINHRLSPPFKQAQQKDEMIYDLQQRPKVGHFVLF
jgi:hypothetical protein